MKLYVLLLIVCSSFHKVTSVCTFPSNLEGSWESPEKGALTINSSSIEGYDIDTYSTLVFGCEVSSGDNYVIRSTDFSVLSNVVNAVLCLSLTQMSTDKYSYYVLTDSLADADNERVRFVSNSATGLTTAEYCNATYVTSTQSEAKIIIRTGTASDQKTQCPDVFLATMYYVGHATCTASSWDGCAAVTDITIDYTLCSETQVYSTSGYAYCVYGSTSGTTSMAYVYNNDTTVDGSTTYQFTCMMGESTSGNISISQNPKSCFSNQTGTYVPTADGGKTLTLGANVTCVPSTAEESVSNAGLVAGLVILFIVLIAAGAAGGYYLYIKKFKKVEPEKERVIDRQASNLTDRQKEAVTPSVVHTDVHSSHGAASHGKIKIKRVPIRRDGAFTPPSDRKKPSLQRTPRRQSHMDQTLISPHTLKPPPSRRRSHVTPLPDIPEVPKVKIAPPLLRLDLEREDTLPMSFSRASTLCEDRISLSLEPDTPVSILQPLSRGQKPSSSASSQVRKKTPSIPGTPRSKRRMTPSLSVKPLQKPKRPVTRGIHTNVVFKDSTTVYKRRIKLVGKVQKKKQSQANRLVAIAEKPSETKTSTPVKKHSDIYKKSQLDLSNFIKEMQRPGDKLKLKPTDSANDRPQEKPSVTPIVKDAVDDNFFSCTGHEEIVKESIIDTKIIVEKLKPSDSINDTVPKTAIPVQKGPINGINTKSHRRTTDDFFNSMVKQMERVAQRTITRSKIQRELSDLKSGKRKNDVAIEDKVMSQVYFNHDHKPKSKVKQRRQRRTIDLSNANNFKRIPTLIQWVECTDILRTPAMKMQDRLADGSINRDTSANTKFSSRNLNLPVDILTDID